MDFRRRVVNISNWTSFCTCLAGLLLYYFLFYLFIKNGLLLLIGDKQLGSLNFIIVSFCMCFFFSFFVWQILMNGQCLCTHTNVPYAWITYWEYTLCSKRHTVEIKCLWLLKAFIIHLIQYILIPSTHQGGNFLIIGFLSSAFRPLIVFFHGTFHNMFQTRHMLYLWLHRYQWKKIVLVKTTAESIWLDSFLCNSCKSWLWL